MRRIISPSILAADFKKLGEQISICEESGAQYLHFDVMDGVFVPSISFGLPVLESIKGSTNMMLDVHLMITDPIRYIKEFAKAGADSLTVHYEACEDLQATVDAIHAQGLKVGIVINPATDVEVLRPFLHEAEMFLLMSVEPGFGGQAFIPHSLDKIRALRAMLEEQGLQTDIEVDGGICHSNVKEVLDAGANVIVSGSSVFRGDIRGNITKYLEIFERS